MVEQQLPKLFTSAEISALHSKTSPETSVSFQPLKKWRQNENGPMKCSNTHTGPDQ